MGLDYEQWHHHYFDPEKKREVAPSDIEPLIDSE
eukprot:SAG31_NODE_18750_length_624_cov_0.828571_1_plen_33_part_10